MSDDDPARRHSWGHLAQTPGDVFVGQTVETVSPDTLGVEALRNGKVVRNRTVAVMKGGIEAGNLKQFRPTHQQRPNRCEVVRLMQGCEGNVSLETRDHALVDDHWRSYFGPPWTTLWPTAMRLKLWVSLSQAATTAIAAGMSGTSFDA